MVNTKFTKKVFLIAIILSYTLITCQDPPTPSPPSSDDDTPIEIGADGDAKNVTSKFQPDPYVMPQEILEHYAEYHTLEEYNNTCSYETIFDGFTEKKLEEKIKKDNCIPNSKTLGLILEAGWFNLTKTLVDEVYLTNLVDPTNIIFTYVRQFENSASKLKFLLADLNTYGKMNAKFDYENFDNNVKINIVLPDESFIVEYLSIYCYKDLFKMNAIFRSRNKFYRMIESKFLFDVVDGECETNYNSFSHKIEIGLNKKNKFKKWTSLFSLNK